MEKCPVCNNEMVQKFDLYKTRFRARDGSIRELVVPNVKTIHCPNCDEALLDEAATRQIEAAQRTALARLSPGELRSWRQSLGKTQTELALILGFGEKTFARWETGAYILNAAADRFIRLLIAKPECINVIEELSKHAAAVDISSSVDDLSHINFDSLDEELKSLFVDGDPAIKISVAFLSELDEGRVFSS